MQIPNHNVDEYVFHNCHVNYREGYRSNMMDFHSHSFYEISLILSGNVKSLVSDQSESGTQCRLMLAAPGVPHFVFMEEPSFYSRLNLCFSVEFVENYVPEWRTLSEVFGKNGRIVLLTEEERDFCKEALLGIDRDRNPFRQRLRILEFLSYVAEFLQGSDAIGVEQPPRYIVGALTYIGEHYAERIVASELAWKLEIGRTTLMTSFKKYTGTTLTEYIMRLRTKEAVALLNTGMSQEEAAVRTGLGNAGGLIRAFRHCYGMTPRQYIKTKYAREGEK